jgi:2-polyprenyl-6-methoxyphenol hydroxylase-like FAD-dependent oxidoreductase
MTAARPLTHDVAVAGGSLGGLFAAGLLHRNGHRVDVFEESARGLRMRGAGLVAQDEIFTALAALGLSRSAVPGVTSTERITLDRGGAVQYREQASQTQLSWDRLYDALRSVVPDDRYHLGATVDDVRLDGDRVRFRTPQGHHDSALLIGADGAQSRIRRAVAPEQADNRYVGYAIWRGLVPESVVPADAAAVLFRRMTFYTGPGEHALGYLIPGPDGETVRGSRRYNWVWYRRLDGTDLATLMRAAGRAPDDTSLAPGQTPPAVARALIEQAHDRLPPAFAAVVALETRPFLQGVLDYVAPRLTRGRALLLGDAAAVVRPHTAMGAAKAAADALDLAALLQDFSIEDALRAYNSARLPIARDIARYGVALGDGLPLR